MASRSHIPNDILTINRCTKSQNQHVANQIGILHIQPCVWLYISLLLIMREGSTLNDIPAYNVFSCFLFLYQHIVITGSSNNISLAIAWHGTSMVSLLHLLLKSQSNVETWYNHIKWNVVFLMLLGKHDWKRQLCPLVPERYETILLHLSDFPYVFYQLRPLGWGYNKQIRITDRMQWDL